MMKSRLCVGVLALLVLVGSLLSAAAEQPAPAIGAGEIRGALSRLRNVLQGRQHASADEPATAESRGDAPSAARSQPRRPARTDVGARPGLGARHGASARPRVAARPASDRQSAERSSYPSLIRLAEPSRPPRADDRQDPPVSPVNPVSPANNDAANDDVAATDEAPAPPPAVARRENRRAAPASPGDAENRQPQQPRGILAPLFGGQRQQGLFANLPLAGGVQGSNGQQSNAQDNGARGPVAGSPAASEQRDAVPHRAASEAIPTPHLRARRQQTPHVASGQNALPSGPPPVSSPPARPGDSFAPLRLAEREVAPPPIAPAPPTIIDVPSPSPKPADVAADDAERSNAAPSQDQAAAAEDASPPQGAIAGQDAIGETSVIAQQDALPQTETAAQSEATSQHQDSAPQNATVQLDPPQEENAAPQHDAAPQSDDAHAASAPRPAHSGPDHVVQTPAEAQDAPSTAQEMPAQPAAPDRRVLTIDRNNPPQPVLRPATPQPPALPELAVKMDVPEELLHGDRARIQVRVANQGRAPARDVFLDIVGNDQLLKTLNVGAVPPGRSADVEIQLTPQVLGQLELQAVAKARDGERAVAVRSMFVGKPELTLVITGAAQIKHGHSQTYTAVIDNQGNADARDVSLLVMLQGKQAQSLEIGNVLAGQRRRIQFELQPEQAGALALNAVATGAGGVQAVANGSIQVMHQDIELSLDGPRQLRLGESGRFTLKVRNRGNVDAGKLVVNVSMGDSVLDSLLEGALPAGQQKQVMFEVSPTQPGNHTLTAVALTDDGTQSAATTRLQVRHGQLELSAQGPAANFSGGEATYEVKVKNTGDAPADDVLITAHLPEAADYLGGVERIEFYEGVTWRVGTLQPGDEQTYRLNCLLETPGEQTVIFNAAGAGELTATDKVVTSVEALADIRLYVADPQGLVPVGEDAVYEIELHNRGVKAARDIQLKMLLGDALQPNTTEGLPAQVNPTGVVFETIDELGPKETRKIRVTMQATEQGAHQFRVEASATNPETFVASEGTTRFYAKARPVSPAPAAPIERTAQPPRDPSQDLRR